MNISHYFRTKKIFCKHIDIYRNKNVDFKPNILDIIE